MNQLFRLIRRRCGVDVVYLWLLSCTFTVMHTANVRIAEQLFAASIVDVDPSPKTAQGVFSPSPNHVNDSVDFDVDVDLPIDSSPKNFTRAIVAISLGNSAAETQMVERFVWSARHGGAYDGVIAVITDAPQERYASISNWTENFLTIEPRQEDYLKTFKYDEMAKKRFKTYILQYASENSHFDGVDLIYYLDIDIIFANPVIPSFEELEAKYNIGRVLPTKNGSKGTMWMFEGNDDKWSVQGGQMILDRKVSQPCLDRWRWYMDNDKTVLKDQVFLNAMIQDQAIPEKASTEAPRCRISIMDQENYIEFPTNVDMRVTANRYRANSTKLEKVTYSPMVHVRNTGQPNRAKRENWEDYMRHLLGFNHGMVDTLGITKKFMLS